MNRLREILPHIVLTLYISVLSSVGLQISFGRIAGLLVLSVVAVLAHFEKRKGSVSPIRKGYLLYLTVNLVGFWILPGIWVYPLRSVPAAFLYASLLMVALIPCLFGGLYYIECFARKGVPSALWGTDVFKKINRNMSWMWCGLFTASLAVALIPKLLSLGNSHLVTLGFQVADPAILFLGLGIPLKRAYPGYCQKGLGIEPVPVPDNSAAGHGAQESSKAKREKIMSNGLRVVAVNGSHHGGWGNMSIMTQMMAPVLAS